MLFRSLLDNVTNLGRVLDQPPSAEVVLIDTPGLGISDLAESAELADFLAARSDLDVHLVLNATTKPRDLRRMIDDYGVFGPRKLLFTRLDETLSFGPLLGEAIRTGRPLSFLAWGPRVAEDLMEAGPQAVADLILGRGSRAACGGSQRA